jgi:hypothetical protein
LSLQAHDIHRIPQYFKSYLDHPKSYVPVQPSYRD